MNVSKSSPESIPHEKKAAYRFVLGVTVVRIPLAVALAVVLLIDFGQTSAVGTLAIAVGAVLLGLGEITDAADGALARRWGVVSETGAALDPYADSISRLIVYWALACTRLASPLVPLVMALRDITVAYCRISWVRQGRSVSAKWSGKLKAIVQAIAAFALLFGPLYWPMVGRWSSEVISWVVILVTAASGIDYLRQAATKPREAA